MLKLHVKKLQMANTMEASMFVIFDMCVCVCVCACAYVHVYDYVCMHEVPPTPTSLLTHPQTQGSIKSLKME